MIPSMIGGPGHKVTSEGRCLSPLVPDPWLEAALQGLEPYLGQESKEVKGSRAHTWAPCLAK